MARTERESDRRREMADLMVLPRPAKSLQNGTGFSGKVEQTGPTEKKRWPQCLRESSWQVRQSRLCQKGKEQNRLSTAPDRKEGIQCQRIERNSGKGKKRDEYSSAERQ